MSDDLDFRVLGPLEVFVGGEPGPRLPPIRRRLLAVLLARADRVITVDELVESLWTGSPPPSAVATLQVHVHRLRQSLGGPERITRGPGGYRISVTAAEFDVLRFGELYERARAERHAERPEAAVGTLESALALWRGEPYAGVEPSPYIALEIDRLNEQRLIAVQALNEARLDLGRHHQAIAPLAALSDAHPYLERIGVLLMIALYRAGRQADALQTFRARRRLLVDELGVEPGELLQRVHEAVLHGDERLKTVASGSLDGDWHPVAAPPIIGGAAAPVPRELPTPPHGFTGRVVELRMLDGLIEQAGPAAPLPIAVVTGMGGIGKTALAVHWGHRVADRFPDGQLYVDLRGHGDATARRPLDVLTAALDALGVPDAEIPTETDRAAARFRTETGGRRLLILLDNAAAADQVRPLIPGGTGSMVLVTSRHRLGDLIVHHGGRRLTLEPLPPADAQTLISGLLHGQPTDRDGIAALADLCGRLPLALRIAAANLADLPQHDIESYAAHLRRGDRLTSLQVDEGGTAIRAVFDSSYRAIPAEARLLFRRMALAPGPDLTADAAAALTGTTVEAIEPVLDRLVSAHLVEQHRPGRYRLHDLLRLYGAERAETEEAPAEAAAAVERLLNRYLHRAETCRDLSYHEFTAFGAPLSEPTDLTPPEATAWLTAERRNLIAAVEHAAAHGPRPIAWRLNDALAGFLWLGSHGNEALNLGRTALAAAEQEGDLPGQAATELSLAWIQLRSNRSAAAVEHGERAVRAAELADWLPGQAAARQHLAYACASIGRLPDARDHAEAALRANRALGSPAQIQSLEALGGIHSHLGDLETAIKYFHEQMRTITESGRPVDPAVLVNLSGIHFRLGRLGLAYELLNQVLASAPGIGTTGPFTGHHRHAAHLHLASGRLDEALASARREIDGLGEHPDSRREAPAVSTLAFVHDARGEHREAVALFDRALELTEHGSFYHRVESMVGRSAALLHLGDLGQARTAATEALDAAREWGYRVFECQARNVLAETVLGLGDPAAAALHAEAALRVGRGTGHRSGEARALRILGDVCEARGEREAAARHHGEARAIIDGITGPLADIGA